MTKYQQKMKNKFVYVVVIATGEYDDYYERMIFATEKKKNASNWVDRFNEIVNKNRDRIEKFDNNGNGVPPFWFDFIYWKNPSAFMQKIEKR